MRKASRASSVALAVSGCALPEARLEVDVYAWNFFITRRRPLSSLVMRVLMMASVRARTVGVETGARRVERTAACLLLQQ
jgi:hypothetical protein